MEPRSDRHLNCSEVGDVAWQCQRREAFHLNADQIYVEFLRNQRPVQEGEEGEVVLTQLYRYSMPLIRYSPGDFAVPGAVPCGCAVSLPTLRALEGRTLNAVPLTNGRVFMGFTRLLSNFPGVVRFQILQKALDHFQVSVVPDAGYSPEVLTKMVEAIHARLGHEIRVDIQPVADDALVQHSRKNQPIIPLYTVDFGNVREA